jgi:ActR/RegA family two-component response regulator
MARSRVLLVDDNESVRITLQAALEMNGFEVASATGVNEALHLIGEQQFDVLVSDLHMPGHGDGLTVVSAMRHSNPKAITLVYSGYPEMKAAVAAILMQADEVLLKPLSVPDLVDAIRKKLDGQKKNADRTPESVAEILDSDSEKIMQLWLSRVEENASLNSIHLTTEQRTAHLPQLLKELSTRLRSPQDMRTKLPESKWAHQHGKTRRMQGYSAPMIVEESRMLQVAIFQILQNNLNRVDFSLVLLDVMTIADEVDSQLCQAMQAFSTEPAPVTVAA